MLSRRPANQTQHNAQHELSLVENGGEGNRTGGAEVEHPVKMTEKCFSLLSGISPFNKTLVMQGNHFY